LPIGREQTISQPFIVALMAQAAQLKPRARVLDVGFGSGYSAAVLAEMGAEVYAVERQTALARRAGKTLKSLGYTSVRWRVGDGTLGWPEAAPFDAIIVAAAGPVPRSLCDQLMIGGRLIIPVPDDRDRQYLKRIRRTSQGDWSSKTLGGVTFVPLISGEKD
jgi:protein-L-isoaspartate(D-aspartate) O-methyltransferase